MMSASDCVQLLLHGALLTRLSYTQGALSLTFDRPRRSNEPSRLPVVVVVEVNGDWTLHGARAAEALGGKQPSISVEATQIALLIDASISGEGARVGAVAIDGATLKVTLRCGLTLTVAPRKGSYLPDWVVENPPPGPPSGAATEWSVVSEDSIVTCKSP
jgi:hypothetical protein